MKRNELCTGIPANFRNTTDPGWKPKLRLGYKAGGPAVQIQVERYSRLCERERQKSTCLAAEERMNVDYEDSQTEVSYIDVNSDYYSLIIKLENYYTKTRNTMFYFLRSRVIL